MTFAIRAIAALAAALSLGVMAYAGDFSSPGLIALAAGFSAWLCAPYAVAWFAAGKLQGDQIASGIIALGTLIAAGFGLYAYNVTFINNPKPDAQDGLVFLMIPLYQLGGMLLLWWVALIVKRLRGR
jgi:hypothetical protein